MKWIESSIKQPDNGGAKVKDIKKPMWVSIFNLGVVAFAITFTILWFDWKLVVLFLLYEFTHNIERHWNR